MRIHSFWIRGAINIFHLSLPLYKRRRSRGYTTHGAMRIVVVVVMGSSREFPIMPRLHLHAHSFRKSHARQFSRTAVEHFELRFNFILHVVKVSGVVFEMWKIDKSINRSIDLSINFFFLGGGLQFRKFSLRLSARTSLIPVYKRHIGPVLTKLFP